MSRANPPDSIDSATGPDPLAGYSWRDVTPEQALQLYEQAREGCPSPTASASAGSTC